VCEGEGGCEGVGEDEREGELSYSSKSSKRSNHATCPRL